jgi:hypothetical protein
VEGSSRSFVQWPSRRRRCRPDCPARSSPTTADILRQILAPIGTDLSGLRDRALLLIGFAAIRVEHPEPGERGLRLTLPHTKGEQRRRRHRGDPVRQHRTLPDPRGATPRGRNAAVPYPGSAA